VPDRITIATCKRNALSEQWCVVDGRKLCTAGSIDVNVESEKSFPHVVIAVHDE